jgi:hypothetical protein
MDIGAQLVVSMIVGISIGIPIYLTLFNKYRKVGKSIKYLEFKIAIYVVLPIMSIPILFSNRTLPFKLLTILAMFLSAIIYAYNITSARRTFRKVMGLPPENEDTGEVEKTNGNNQIERNQKDNWF